MGYPTISYPEPKKSIQNMIKIKTASPRDRYKQCPAFIQQLKNVYSLLFPFDYGLSFDWEKEYCKSDYFDQDCFDTHVEIREFVSKTFSLHYPYLFFCEEELVVEATSAYTADNDFVNKTMIIPGRFDIGRWFRPIDCTFIVKDNVDKIDWKRNQDFCHLNFRTDKKIILKRFFATHNLLDMVNQIVASRDYKKIDGTIDYLYDIFESSGIKKLILKEIKENLL